MSSRKGSNPMSEVFFALCKTVNSATSLGLWLCYKYGDFDAIMRHSIDPRSYLNASTFEKDYLVVSYISKYRDLNTSFDLEQEALSSFKSAEESCLLVNKRIRQAQLTGFDPVSEAQIFCAQKKIAKLLGPFSLHKVTSKCGWGPGATYEFPREVARLDSKICKLPFSVTRKALGIAKSVIENDLHWSSVILGVKPEDILGPYDLLPQCFQVVEGCRVTTVPKNAKTDRTIAIEPRLNGFLQKGVGSFIRARLATVGIDLNNQELNQDGARRAYSEELATLDLKAASDSICRELVYLLLPLDWAMYLDDIRSENYLLDKTWSRFHKISSMGNGFTFELESLIFWALGSSVLAGSDPSPRNFLVYGDDIIIPRRAYCQLCSLLELLGFTVNKTKSFAEGNFFESCGKHYFQGQDVTPVYQKDPIGHPIENVRGYNRVARHLLKHLKVDEADISAHPLLKAIERLSSRDLVKYQIPYGAEGDDGYLTPHSLFEQDTHGIFTCRVFKETVHRRRLWNPPLYSFWQLL